MADNPPIIASLAGKYPDQTLIVTEVNSSVVFDTGGWDSFTLQMTKDGDADLTSMVLKVQKSNDARNPVDFASAVTQSSEGMTAKQDVTAIGFVHAKITTAGTSGRIRLFARAQKQVR